MTSNNDKPGGPHETHSSDADIVDQKMAVRVRKAVEELQEAMDAVLLGGLVVESTFTQVANRLTRSGMRIDSAVCNLRVYRKLT